MDVISVAILVINCVQLLGLHFLAIRLIAISAINELFHINSIINPKYKTTKNIIKSNNSKIEHFRLVHSRLVAFIGDFNKQFMSPFFGAFLLSNLPFNSYLIMYIIYFKVSDFLYYFLIILLFVQFAIPILNAYILVQVNDSMKYSLPSMYFHLSEYSNAKVNFREHWKTMTYYEFLNQTDLKFISLSASLLGVFNRQNFLNVSKLMAKNLILIYFCFNFSLFFSMAHFSCISAEIL